MSAQDYVEAIAHELSRLKGRGLLLSPADSALALAWHAQGVPLQKVVTLLREQGPRLLPRAGREKLGPNASAAPQISLQLFASALSARPLKPPPRGPGASLASELTAAASAPTLPARAEWLSLAARADELLAGGPAAQRDYWSLALQALSKSLRELGRPAALQAGATLRKRLSRRPPSMTRARYRRSLQILLLSAASSTLGVPPPAFLL
jgi:hypothetical protein